MDLKVTQRRRWLTRRRVVVAVSSFIFLGILAVNALAFMQARAMTHFVDGGNRSAKPEALTLLGKIDVVLTGVRIPRPENDSTPESVGLNFQTVHFGGADGRDCEGWLIPSENSRGLCIQFPAYTTSKVKQLPAALAFHELGYDVLMIDYRGCGGSRGNTTTIGFAEADDVAAAFAFAQQQSRVEPVILFGQSMGGAAILRAIAKKNVNPSAVIIESTYDRLLSTVENRFHAMGIPSFPLARLLVFWGGEQEGFNGFALNPADYATKVRCPTLVFQGGKDLRVTNAQARNLFDHLAGAKQFELFEQSNHCTFLADDRARWIGAVKRLLAGN
jgi:alpha-beta hydrolase superfamily lysophospholipase